MIIITERVCIAFAFEAHHTLIVLINMHFEVSTLCWFQSDLYGLRCWQWTHHSLRRSRKSKFNNFLFPSFGITCPTKTFLLSISIIIIYDIGFRIVYGEKEIEYDCGAQEERSNLRWSAMRIINPMISEINIFFFRSMIYNEISWKKRKKIHFIGFESHVDH